MGRVVLGALAALALGGCATEPMPSYSSHSPTGLPAPTPGPSIFDTAPHASVRGELLACSANGSNIGPIGDHRQSLEYTPYIQTAAGAPRTTLPIIFPRSNPPSPRLARAWLTRTERT